VGCYVYTQKCPPHPLALVKNRPCNNIILFRLSDIITTSNGTDALSVSPLSVWVGKLNCVCIFVSRVRSVGVFLFDLMYIFFIGIFVLSRALCRANYHVSYNIGIHSIIVTRCYNEMDTFELFEQQRPLCKDVRHRCVRSVVNKRTRMQLQLLTIVIENLHMTQNYYHTTKYG